MRSNLDLWFTHLNRRWGSVRRRHSPAARSGSNTRIQCPGLHTTTASTSTGRGIHSSASTATRNAACAGPAGGHREPGCLHDEAHHHAAGKSKVTGDQGVRRERNGEETDGQRYRGGDDVHLL